MINRSIFDTVKLAARGHWSPILRALAAVDESALSGKQGPCPVCGGTSRFRAFGDFEETGGTICNQCGAHPDGISTLASCLDCSQSEAAKIIAEHLGIDHQNDDSMGKRESPGGSGVLRGQVYREILRACPLRDEERRNLQNRGLVDQEIAQGEYGTLEPSTAERAAQEVLSRVGCTEDELCSVPGIVRERGTVMLAGWLGPGSLIPSRGPGGVVQAIKVRRRQPQDGQPRYVSLSGGKKHNQNAGAHCHVPVGTPSSCETVRVTEGELKADITFNVSKLPTISVPGIAQWKLAIPVLQLLGARKVLIAYDAPEYVDTTKCTARLALAFARELLRCGFDVELENWRNDAGKGIDDALAAGHETTAMKLDGLLSLRPDLKSPDADKLPRLAHSSLGPEAQTELANSRRFCDLHGDRVRYCFPWKTWFVWDGKRWKEDSTASVERLAKDVPDALWNQALESSDSNEIRFAALSARANSIRAMLDLARSELHVSPKQLDKDGWLLNCANGTLDLRTGVLRDWNRSEYLSCLCPTAYHPKARSDIWESFLASTFGGDKDLIEYLQRLLGYCLTAQVTEQLLPVMFGAGANGKSTLLSAFMSMLGCDYAMKAPHDLLLAKQSSTHPTDLADLHRKRFVACVETPDSARLNETLVKELTGGDRIRARKVFRDSFEFDPTHKLVLCTNYKPRVAGTDHGIWRRVALIPFGQMFWNAATGETGPSAMQIDPTLPQKLSGAREAILAWCVEGCFEWQRHGLKQPQMVRQATSEYRCAEDVILQWLEERCLQSADEEIRAATAYADFRKWCMSVGECVASNTKFGLYMKSRFKDRKSNGVLYLGVRLNPTMDGLEGSGPN